MELLTLLEKQDYFSEKTESICPVCLKKIDGTIRESKVGLLMEKSCPVHGDFKATIGTDLQSYRQLCSSTRKVTHPLEYESTSEHGCPDDCGICPAHEQHTCLAILEITSRCDLGCPICLAGSVSKGKDLEIADIKYALTRLIDYEGALTPIQISGGEPTLHPQLLKIVETIRSLGGGRVELNTNGVALGKDHLLAEELMKAGLSSIYLQFDSLDPEASKFIRGKDLVLTKVKAIENSIKAGLEVILSVTIVPGVNDQELWDLVRFGMKLQVTGINFQTLVLSGRYPGKLEQDEKQFTSGHFLKEIYRQSNGVLLEGDLRSIPCPDPRCSLITYAFIHKGELLPLNRLLEEEMLLDCMADLKNWSDILQQIQSKSRELCCAKEKQHFEALLETLPHSDLFSIGFHGMMDAQCLDLDRVRRCCVHNLTSQGKLIPFCLYHIKYR